MEVWKTEGREKRYKLNPQKIKDQQKKRKKRKERIRNYSRIKGKYKERTSKEKHTSNGETPKA